MKPEALARATVPVAYALLILERAQACGVTRAALLDGLGIADELLEQADARLGVVPVGMLLLRALKLTDDPALGYEIGLSSNLTTHGFIGYGVMSHQTLREAVQFGMRYLPLRLPNLRMTLLEEGATAVLDVAEVFPQGPLRACMFELFLSGLSRMAVQLMGVQALPLMSVWFAGPEPAHHARYRDRLPPARFRRGVFQLRFPAAFLDQPLATANTVTARLVSEQCVRELRRLGLDDDLPAQVRALLEGHDAGYPSLAAVAVRLGCSARTLKRRLRQHGCSYSSLLDAVRRQDSVRLLGEPALSIEQVAECVGYGDPANFTRAFRRWTGLSPTAWRRQSATDPG